MSLYELMNQYARENKIPPAAQGERAELGHSLALFHDCLLESGMKRDETGPKPLVAAGPDEIRPFHLSHFIIGFLPFNAVTGKNEINHVLFETYSFFKWMETKNIPHGLSNMNFTTMVRDLSSRQERCLKLSHLLDGETGRVLEDPPEIVHTINDIFSVVKMEKDFVYLKGKFQDEVIRLRLPSHIMSVVELNDHMDLVLGDTSEKWVLLEAGQVFPAYSP